MTSAPGFDIHVSDDVDRVRGTRSFSGSWDWFQRLWGIAVIAHMVGNPARGQLGGEVTALGVFSFIMGLVAVAAVLRPDDRRLLWALAAAIPLSAWLETPVLSNHWLLAGMISLALLGSRVFNYGWEWFATAARAMVLAFYGFALLAKLNWDFFDPTVSCAVVYANHSLQALGLPGTPSDSALAAALPFLVATVEAAIPFLLLRARTRYLGVMLALVFHVIVSVDLDQHFYDFTAVLVPLLLLWISDAHLDTLGEYLPERTQVVAGVTLSLFVVASVLPGSRLTTVLLDRGIFLVWVPYVLALIVFVAMAPRSSHETAFKPPNAVGWLLLALVMLNGLAPYIEVKTANSWNMYSNLSIVNGESNHLILQRLSPVGDGHGELVEIIRSSDPGLTQYIGSDWRLTERSLGAYLQDTPGVDVEVRIGGLAYRSDELQLTQQGLLARRLVLMRAVDVSSPTACQTVWLPAN